MAFAAMDMAAQAHLPLMPDHHLHIRRLADDAGEGTDGKIAQHLQQAAHAEAAHLLVIGEDEMDRRGRLAPQHLGGLGQQDAEEGLHIGGAAAEEPSVMLGQQPGIAVPVLTIDGHHVGMAGKGDAGLVAGPEGGVEIGLAPGFVMHETAMDAETRKMVGDEVDELEIGVPACGVHGDEAADHLDAFDGTRHRHTP